jgi:UDP-N-acetyl-D-galactosamine dehydrogenase
VKVVAGEDEETLERVAAVYEAIVPAGVYRAPSIKVAEAAKVIENTQRDLNIALMNELAIVFDRMGVRTSEVLEAAGTKWNFLPFTPGLVGGHCIGVDPYYLTAKAEQLGYHPQVILAGRRINDGMSGFIAQKVVKLLSASDLALREAKVGILGITFKENVPDLRNSKVPDIVKELIDFGVTAHVHDPMVSSKDVKHEYGVDMVAFEDLRELDVLILAVPHRRLMELGIDELLAPLKPSGIVIDVKSKLDPADLPDTMTYWSL